MTRVILERKEEKHMMTMFATSTLAEGAASGIDFTEAFTTAINNIQTSYAGLATIAIGVGLTIWGAPKAIQLVKRFFSSLTR